MLGVGEECIQSYNWKLWRAETERLNCWCEGNIKMDQIGMWGFGLVWSPLVVFCEDGTEFLGFVRSGVF